jgi:hypothetical protein
VRCLRSKNPSDESFYYKSASARLQRELDIKHFIKSTRLFDNVLKWLTSKRERRLVYMQASKEVVSKLPGDQKTTVSSSDFDSDNFESYLTRMLEKVEDDTLNLTNRE